MDIHDFPRILGNLGVETEHRHEMCAGLVVSFQRATSARAQVGWVVKNSATQREHGRLWHRRKTTEKPQCIQGVRIFHQWTEGRRHSSQCVPQKTAVTSVP